MYNFIQNLDIQESETIRMDCPECRGRKTFTVTNNNGHLLWNCYKASCNVSGTHKMRMSAESIYRRLNMTEENYTTEFCMPVNIVPLSSEYEQAMAWAFGWNLSPNRHGLMYDIREHRVVFPVVHSGVTVDATGRAIGRRLPKWKRYGNNNLPYFYGNGKTSVVVEDCVSAATIGGNTFVGVAILGTSLSEEHKNFLSQFSTTIIALDPDAMPKIFAFAKELRGYVKDIKVLRLTDDLKYKNKKDITNLYNLTPKE